jgi:hypothetical protein
MDAESFVVTGLLSLDTMNVERRPRVFEEHVPSCPTSREEKQSPTYADHDASPLAPSRSRKNRSSLKPNLLRLSPHLFGPGDNARCADQFGDRDERRVKRRSHES